MHSIRTLELHFGYLLKIRSVPLLCGATANNRVYSLSTNIASYAHNPLFGFIKNRCSVLCTNIAHTTNLFIHIIFVHFISVKRVLCTQSTMPTITTTY